MAGRQEGDRLIRGGGAFLEIEDETDDEYRRYGLNGYLDMKGIENPPEKPRLFACLIPHVGHDFIGKPGRRLHFIEAGQQGVRLPISGQLRAAGRASGDVVRDELRVTCGKLPVRVRRQERFYVITQTHRSPTLSFSAARRASRALKSLDFTVPSGMLRISLISS